MHEVFRHRALGGLSKLVSRRPKWILFFAFVLAAASLFVTWKHLSFDANRDHLISQKLSWVKQYKKWNKNFGQVSDVIVVDTYNKQGKPDPKVEARAKQLVEQLGEKLKKSHYVKMVMWGFNKSQVNPKAMRLLPMDQFKSQLKQIEQSGPLLKSATPSDFLSHLTSMMQSGGKSLSPAEQAQGLHSLSDLIDAFNTRLKTPAGQPVDLMNQMGGDLNPHGWEYLWTPNHRMMLIPLTPKASGAGLNPLQHSLSAIRQLLTQKRKAFPSVSFGLTGGDALAVDETSAAMRGSTKASIISVFVIAILLMFAFRSVRKPIMLMISLLIAIAWTFGYLTLVVGHLQVISVVFTVMLLGLGVAFGIHLLARFELVRHQYPDDETGFTLALRDTLETIGPGLLTGAVTTAAAFCTTMLTDFTGVAEMGMIAGAGVILCLISMVTVFPAMIRLFKPGLKDMVPMAKRRVHFFQEHWMLPMSHHPIVTLAIAGLITLASLAAVTQIRFDYNLLGLMPPKAPSVVWQQKLTREGKQSIYSAAVVTDSLDQVRTLTQKFRKLPAVESVQGIGRIVPKHDNEKLQLLAKAKTTLDKPLSEALHAGAHAPTSQPASHLVTQLASFRFLLGIFSQSAGKALQPGINNLNTSIDHFLATAHSLPKPKLTARLAALDKDYTHWRIETAKLISKAIDSSPMTPNDLPKQLLSPYIAKANTPSGHQYSLEITPATNAQVNDPLAPSVLSKFVESIKKVDPHVTGPIMQIYNSGIVIWRSYLDASLYAFGAVLLLVWLDFRSLRDAIMTLLPVGLGFATTFGIMWCIGEKVNPANIIVLPLMFGIGVDAGVHMIHRFRQSPHRRPLGLTQGTGKGISLTSYTTMIGFGSLLIAKHRGIQSLGLVLAMGIGMTLLACWTVMPACLELFARHRQRKDQSASDHTTTADDISSPNNTARN